MEFSCCLQLHNDPVVVEESEDTALVERNENFRADFFQSRSDEIPYVINWDSIACDSRDFLVMGDPFQTYNEEVERFLAKPRTIPPSGEQ